MLPVSATIVVAILQTHVQKAIGNLGLILLALYASSNSLLTILFVTPYRRYTLTKLNGIVRRIDAWLPRRLQFMPIQATTTTAVVKAGVSNVAVNSQGMRIVT